MRIGRALLVLCVGLGVFSAPALAKTEMVWREKVSIPSGEILPLFGVSKDQTPFPLKAFQIDKVPVTEREFSVFLKKHPEWKRGNASPLFADGRYLLKRSSRESGRAPVVFVSWFAANAFCEAQGGRLPSTLEWEYVAAASETVPNALKDPQFVARILGWYSSSSAQTGKKEVGRGRANFYGVHDLHELIWEWTSDFNSVFVAADNRQDGDEMKNLFCGSGASGAANREDYAAFMRYAMRSSLQANYTTSNLGFRCAYEK